MATPRVCRFFFSESGCQPPTGRCRFRHSHDAFKCSCGVLVLNSIKDKHLRGHKHRRFSQQQQQTAAPNSLATQAPLPAPEEDRTEKCTRCQRILFAVDMGGHMAEHEHQDKIRQLQAELAKAEEDKEDVTVDLKEGVSFGVIEAGGAAEMKLNVQRVQGRGPVRLVNCFMRSSLKKDGTTSPFSASLTGRGIAVTRNKPRLVNVVFSPSYNGSYEDILELVFSQSNRRRFIIARRVYGTAGSREDHEELKPKGPYKKKKYVPLDFDGPILPNPRPPVWSGIRWVNIMPKFDPPKALIEAAFKPNKAAAHKAVKRLMPATFDINTYGNWFQNLLYIEGVQRQRDIDELYTQRGVELVARQFQYILEVRGIADGRPSVLVGDYIYARKSGEFHQEDNAWYTGRVHEVFGDSLTLHFSKSFGHIRGTRYDIRFNNNRVPERRKHQAVAGPYKPIRALFPDESHIQYYRVTPADIETINPINRYIAKNDEQLGAVTAICKQPPGSVPFVIFGPPGTGKTVTMVEAIQQVLLSKPGARILACAPSNTAADTLAVKLINLGKTQLFRLNSLSRPPQKLLSGLQSFSLVNDNTVFAFPQKEELQRYRVIVSTCISAGALWGIGLRKGHFTHIFIDEAGQGQEPDIMVPFLSLADDNTNLVLAGDHQQLGPEVNSPIAKSYGLRNSYLLRMMERKIYDLKFGFGLTVVKLLKNFRNHPTILEFSNKHFYSSELKACGDHAITHSLENIDELPTKRFPIIFHGIIGKDQREESSPSFFNIDEVTIVKDYCHRLMANRKKNIRPEDIGVITPYHNQRCRIQKALYRDERLKEIKVGSVDEFQGQERRIIILSTVRSTLNHVELDVRRSLGFVASPLRLNVAMTRAQALLIVVGNPIVLSLDPLWRSFLSYVHEKGGWRGVDIKWGPEEPVNLPNHNGQYRERAEAEMKDTLTRLRAMVSQNLEQYNIDLEDDDNSDDEYSNTGEMAMNRDYD